MPQRYVGDTTRALLALLVAAPVAAVAAIAFGPSVQGGAGSAVLSEVVLAVLIAWPLFVAILLAWTHRSYLEPDVAARRERARRDRAASRRRGARVPGYGAAAAWTIGGALLAVALTVTIAQNADLRGNGVFVVLALVSVAASWALMVYAFAMQYLRLAYAGGDTVHLRPAVVGDEEARFGDYLTLAVLVSTMAATVSADIRTRDAWRIVRVNVLLAFALNSHIVAVILSLVISRIADR